MPLQTRKTSVHSKLAKPQFPLSLSLSPSLLSYSSSSSSAHSSPSMRFRSLPEASPCRTGFYGVQADRPLLGNEYLEDTHWFLGWLCYLEGRAVDVAIVAIGLDVNPEIAARDATNVSIGELQHCQVDAGPGGAKAAIRAACSAQHNYTRRGLLPPPRDQGTKALVSPTPAAPYSVRSQRVKLGHKDLSPRNDQSSHLRFEAPPASTMSCQRRHQAEVGRGGQAESIWDPHPRALGAAFAAAFA